MSPKDPMTSEPCRVVVLISGSGTNLQALIDEQNAGNLPIEIVGVISNRPGVKGLERAEQAGIPSQIVDHTQFSSREDFDEAIASEILRFAPDLVVLAGYMRIMTPKLVKAFEGKMLNIHPSLLPKYPGLNTHRRALENGDQEHGSSVHFVTEILDGGPLIAQSRISIHDDDTEQTLSERIKLIEHKLYPQVVRWFAEGRLAFKNNHTYFDGQKLERPLPV
jgi:phosphoribosylglycinamide formyltransferase-1